MGAGSEIPDYGQPRESVHVCPNCGNVVNLAELNLRAITTGMVTCPGCKWSGQIEIQVVDQVPRKKPTCAEKWHYAEMGRLVGALPVPEFPKGIRAKPRTVASADASAALARTVGERAVGDGDRFRGRL
jgi:predicted RNA-binding Zn-ribbon protein involved in translation (DUF1610 family)